MASTNASINLLVTGITKLDRALQRVDQIDAIVSRLNKTPIDISRNTAEQAFKAVGERVAGLTKNTKEFKQELVGVEREIGKVQKTLDQKTEKLLASTNKETKTYKKLEEDIKSLSSTIDELNAKKKRTESALSSAGVSEALGKAALRRSKENKEAISQLQDLADSYLAVGDAQNRLATGKKGNPIGLDTSVAQLKEQASVLSLISNSVKITTSDFNRFAIAAEVAGTKLAKADQARLKALAFGLSSQAERVNVGPGSQAQTLAGSRKVVAEAIKMGDSVTRSEAAMESYVGYLDRLRSIVPALSDEYRALEEQIAGVRKEMSSFGLRGQSEMLKIPAPQGPASVLGDPKSIVKKQGYYDKIEDQLSRIAAIETRVDQAFLDQDQKLQLRQKLEKAVGFLAENKLDAAKRETAEIDRQRMSLERMNRRGQGAAKSAAFSPLDGAKRLNNILASGETLRQKLLTLQVSGVDVTDRLSKLESALNAAKQEGYEISLKNLGALDDELNSTRQLLQLERARADTKKAAERADAEAAKLAKPADPTGLAAILSNLSGASKAASEFRGGRTGEQALSDIISAFNKTQRAESARGGSAALADERTGVEREIDRYKQIFAGLTSNPRFYGELLSKLPREAITTTMAGAATEREASIRRPGLSAFRAGGGAGDLEGQILSEYKKVFGEVPSGVKQLFDKIGSVFDAIVGRPAGGGGGGRPPIGPGGPSGPGDFGDEINNARGNTQRLLGLADIADMSGASIKELQLFSQALSETREGVKMTDASFNRLTKVLDRVDDRIARTDPNADFLTRRFGQRGGQAVGEGLIGGAFPLLFGQGAGAAAGGGLGGFFGGMAGGTLGFGLSLAGTAIGSQVDLLAQAAQDTGNTLRELSSDVSGAFEKIKDSGLLASREQEKLVAGLLEAGNKTAAYSIIQEELNQKLGIDGAAKLKAAADAGDNLNRAMADLGVQMQLFIAGPLTDLLNKLSEAVNARTTENRVQGLLATLPEGQRKKFQAQLSKEAAANSPFSGPFGALFGFNAQRAGQATGGGERSLIPQKRLNELVAEFSRLNVPAIPQTAAEQRQAAIRGAESNLAGTQRQLDLFNKKNEGLDLAKGFKQQVIAAKREQEDLDRQAFELRRDYERQIEDIRRGIEDRISQIRQENQQKELEILAKQGQVREQQFKNAATALQGALAGDPLAQSLADAVTTYLGAQMSAQDQLEQRRKQFEIEISNQQVETEKYKLEVGRTLSRLNTDTAEKVAEINRGVRRRNEDTAMNEFKLQKESAKLRAMVIGQELKVMLAKQQQFLAEAQTQYGKSPTPDTQKLVEFEQRLLTSMQNAVEGSVQNIKDVEAVKAPQLAREIAAPATRSVSFAGVNQGIARANQLREQLKGLEEDLVNLVKTGNLELFANQLADTASRSFFEINNSLNTAKEQAALANGDIGPSLKGIMDSYNQLFALAKQRGVNIDEPLRQYIEKTRDAQIAFEKIKPSMEFYASNLQDITSQTKQSRAAVDELLLPTKAYDKALAQINARGGLGINPEEEQLLLKNARALDEINAQLKVLEGLRDIASGWTDSFIQLNKELLKGGNLLESVQRFAESVADRTLDVVLEFTLRPIQERLFKSMTDILGIKPPEDPALQPIRETAANTKNIFELAKNVFAGKTGIQLPQQPAAAQAPANAIVPGPNAAQRQGYPEYIDKSALRNWLISQGFGRTSGDYTNAGHRTPNHMLNAMDMGILGGSDAEALRKTSEMERKLRATGAFGNQLFGPINDPYGHGAGKGGQNIHLHIPTPGGRVKVTPGLAELMNLGQPMQGSRTYPSAGSGQPIDVSVVEAPALVASGFKGPGQPVALPVVPFAEPQQQPAVPIAPAANQAAESLVNLDQKVREAADGVQQFDSKTSEAVSKFQTIVGTGLQAITSVAMGIGGAQMIRKGGAYNTLMGAASIFGSIGSIAGMFAGPKFDAGTTKLGAGGGVVGGMGTLGPNFGLGARALGGPVFSGNEYLVGEQGPEVIRMGANGTVIPTDELYVPGLDDKGSSSAPPVGRYARRSNASSDMADGDSEGTSYGDTYQRGSSSTTYVGNYGRAVPYQRSETTREIDRLERVTSNPSELPPIKYETTRVNEYDFVTPDQLEASNARTAKIARNQTIRELADSMKTRKRLGL